MQPIQQDRRNLLRDANDEAKNKEAHHHLNASQEFLCRAGRAGVTQACGGQQHHSKVDGAHPLPGRGLL